MIEPPTPNYEILFAVRLSPIKRYGNRKKMGCSPASLKVDVDFDLSDIGFGKIDWLESEQNDDRAEMESSNCRRKWC